MSKTNVKSLGTSILGSRQVVRLVEVAQSVPSLAFPLISLDVVPFCHIEQYNIGRSNAHKDLVSTIVCVKMISAQQIEDMASIMLRL